MFESMTLLVFQQHALRIHPERGVLRAAPHRHRRPLGQDARPSFQRTKAYVERPGAYKQVMKRMRWQDLAFCPPRIPTFEQWNGRHAALVIPTLRMTVARINHSHAKFCTLVACGTFLVQVRPSGGLACGW